MTTARHRSSPARPAVAVGRTAADGETTKGGLETTRSKRSPATGSNRLPARRSTSRPFRAAVRAAKARARGFVSVADDRSMRAGPGAAPAPRSRCRGPGRDPTCGRTVTWARVVDAPPIPEHVVRPDRSRARRRSRCPGRRRRGSRPRPRRTAGCPPSGQGSGRDRSGADETAVDEGVQPAQRPNGRARRRPAPAGRRAGSSVSSGEPPRVARSAGTVSPRASAAYAAGPSSSRTPSTV